MGGIREGESIACHIDRRIARYLSRTYQSTLFWLIFLDYIISNRRSHIFNEKAFFRLLVFHENSGVYVFLLNALGSVKCFRYTFFLACKKRSIFHREHAQTSPDLGYPFGIKHNSALRFADSI